MNKYFRKWASIVVLAALFIFAGAITKLTGSSEAILVFSDLNLLGLPENNTRVFFALFEIVLAIGFFIRPIRRVAAFMASILLVVALWYHITNPLLNFPYLKMISLGFSLWVLLRRPTDTYMKKTQS